MKKIYFLFTFILSISVYSQSVVYSYSFEDDGSSSYTTSTPEFSDGYYDFFTSTFNNSIGNNYGVTGQDGNYYFAAQDMDGDGATVPQTLTMTYDITGLNNLGFKILVAEDDYKDPKWDDDDYVHIDYAIDNGSPSPLIYIESEGSGYNTETRVDTDFNGVGDGEAITEAFMELEAPISGTGSTLTVTFTFSLDSGNEDIAFDNIRILKDYVADTTPTLNITNPKDGSTIYSKDVSIEFIVQNFSVGNTTTDDGHIHYILDSDQPVMKYDTTPVSLTNLAEGQHTITISLVDNSHNPLDPAIETTISFTIIDPLTSLPYQDSFNYNLSSLNGQNKWQELYSGDDIMVVDQNLTYDGTTSTGKMISFSGSGKESFIEIDPTQDGITFISFWLNVNDISTITDSDGGYFALFGSERSSGGIEFESRIWLKPSTDPIANTYNLSFSSASSNPDYITASELNVDETYLIVMSYNSNSGEVLGWINPSSSSAPALMTSTDSSPNVISYFVIRQDSNSETASIDIDELKIGSSLTYVLDVVELNGMRVAVYPNPTQTTLNFSGLNAPVQASVFDMLGKLHIQTEVTNTLDVSALKSGLYMVEIKNETSSKAFKMLKQ